MALNVRACNTGAMRQCRITLGFKVCARRSGLSFSIKRRIRFRQMHNGPPSFACSTSKCALKRQRRTTSLSQSFRSSANVSEGRTCC